MYLAECLESLLAQTVPPSQIIVVDDGSTDNTSEIVCGFGSRVTYLYKENGGKSIALNYALLHVTSDLVWFFDDDDVAYPDAIESHLKTHAIHPDIGFSYGFHDLGRDGRDGRIVVFAKPKAPAAFSATLQDQRLNLLKYCAFMLCACVCKVEVVKRIGGFSENFLRSQDYEFLVRLSQASAFQYTGSRIYIFRKHDGERGPQAIRHQARDRRRVWAKYDHELGQVILASIPLGRFIFSGDDDSGIYLKDIQKRVALIHRATVMASKTNIVQAVDDVVQASELCRDTSLTRSELEWCQSLPDHPYFLFSLGERPLNAFTPLLDIGGSKVGQEIQLSLAKGLYRQCVMASHDRGLKSRVLTFSWAFALLASRAVSLIWARTGAVLIGRK